MKEILCILITAPAWIWIGFWFRILEKDMYNDLDDFMHNREKWYKKEL